MISRRERVVIICRLHLVLAARLIRGILKFEYYCNKNAKKNTKTVTCSATYGSSYFAGK